MVAKGTEKVTESFNILIYRVDHKRLKEVDDTEQYIHVYQVKIGDRFAAYENSDYSGEINRAWENIRNNVKSLAECGSSISHKSWYDEGSDL